MSYNLPPGVNENMIPGNTQEDAEWDKFWSSLDFNDLSVQEASRAVQIGVDIVRAGRRVLKRGTHNGTL